MTMSQLSLLVTLLLIGFSHGAPSQMVSRQSECSPLKSLQDDLKCLTETLLFQNKIRAITEAEDMDEKSKFDAMIQACVPVRDCFSTTVCLTEPFSSF